MKKGDIILFFAIIVISVALIIGIFLFNKEGEVAVIKEDNQILGKFPLNQDAEISLEHNTVTIKNNEVFVSSADCPDKVCFKTNPINKRGETIICLPNKVIIEIQ